MKREDLEKALGGMEDSFIESANQRRSNKERPVFWPVAAAAAVLLLSVVGISIYGKNAAEKNRNETLEGDVRTIEETTAVWEETVAEPQYDGPNFLRMPITDGNFAWNMTRKEVLEELVRLVGIEDSVTAEAFESEEEYIQAMEKTFIDKGLLEAEKEDVIGDEMQLKFNWPLETSFGTSSTTRFEFIDYSFLDEDFVPDMPRGQRLTKIVVILSEKSVTGQQMLDELTDFYDESDPATKIYDPLAGLLSSSFNFKEEYTPTTLYEAIKYENWKVGNLPEERKKIYYELFELNRERMIRQGIDQGMTKEMAEAMVETECDQMYNDDRVMLYLTLMGTNFEEPNPIAITFEMDWLYYLANCIEESRSTLDEVGIEEPIPNFLRMPITEGNFVWNMTRKEVLEELMRLAGIEDSVKAEEFESEDEYCQRMKRMLEEVGALQANANEEYLSSPDDAKLAYTRPLKCSLGVSYDTVFFFSDYSFMDRGLPPNAPKGLQLTSIHIILTENEKTGAQLVDELSEFYGESDPITEINSPLPDITNYDFHSTVYEPRPQFELVKYENWKVGNLPEERKKIYYELYELNRERVMRQLLEDQGLSQEQAQIQADIAANETLNDEKLMLNISLFGPNLDEPNVVAVRYELDYFYTLANCIEESRNTSDEGDIEDPTARAFRMPITAGNFSWNMTRKEVLEEMVRLVGIEKSVKAEAFENEEEYCLEMQRRLFHGGALYVWREDFIGVSSVLEFVYPLETEFGISNCTRFDFRDYEQIATDEYTNKPMSQFPLQFIKFYLSESPQTGDQWVDDLTEYYNESNPEIEISSMSDWMTDPEAAEYDEYSFKVYNTKLGFENWKISSLSEEKQALYRKVKNAFHLNRLEDDQILEIIISSDSLNSAVPVQISFNFDPSFMLMNSIENGNEEELKEAKALWEEMNNLSQDTTN